MPKHWIRTGVTPICGWPERPRSEEVRSVTRREGEGEYTVKEYRDGLLQVTSGYDCPIYPGTVEELLAALEDRDRAGFQHQQAIFALLRLWQLPVTKCRCARKQWRVLMPLRQAAPLRSDAQYWGFHLYVCLSCFDVWDERAKRGLVRRTITPEEVRGLHERLDGRGVISMDKQWVESVRR